MREKEYEVLKYEPFEGGIAKLVNGKVQYKAHRNLIDVKREEKAEARLYWSESEGRWLAEVSGKFLESTFDKEEGRELWDKFGPLGPLRLNQSACQKLLEAYGIKPEKVDLSQVDRLSPSELEKLASANK
ncbi:hypothetical protein FJZ19_04495 [Candidatus Pacearchaeota archaeon]|nr:hypothetical protein [Candidatus Pacearchaeota archaeon]